jgi:hypothetical protein
MNGKWIRKQTFFLLDMLFRPSGPKRHPQSSHPTAQSAAAPSHPGRSSRMDRRLEHKASLKLQKTEVTQNVFSTHNGMQTETSERRKTGKFINTRK